MVAASCVVADVVLSSRVVASMSLPRRPDFDICRGYLGPPRCGKTSAALVDMLELRDQTPCYLLAHDPGYAIPDKLHTGRATGLRRHATVAELAAAVEKGDTRSLHVSMELDATPLVIYAKRLGEQSMRTADPKELAAPCPPVVLLVDEVGRCKEMGAMYLGPNLEDALMRRRHNHVGLFYTSQSPRRVHHEFLGNSNALHVCGPLTRGAIARLVEDGRFPEEVAAKIPKLRQFERVSRID